MSKVTKKDLQYQINGLAAEASTRHNSIMRIHRALASIGVDIFSDYFDLTEPEPQLKQLDQSVFNNMHERWKFAAVDKNGSAHRFSKEVIPYRGGFCYEGEDYNEFKFSLIGKGYDASNWQNSLVERDIAKELTGSDLARAMLERGDKFVMCLVFDDTRNLDVTYVIRGYHDGYFHTKRNSWENAIPINNQGEPLTASEVGL